METPSAVHYEKVSLTAKLAAYMRQFSDILFAQDVAAQLRAGEAFEQLMHQQSLSAGDLTWYAPIFEVRYKSIATFIRRSGVRQVLELASGFALRGLALTRDPAIIYVESDLAALTQEKTALVAALRRTYGLTDYGNLHLATANALDAGELQAAAQCFRRDQPIAVAHEGLLQYLTGEEMLTVAQHIHTLLAAYGAGSVWITPDFSLRAEVGDVSPQHAQFRRAVAAATDRTLYSHAFADEAQLRESLHGLGLHAQTFNQLDLVSDVVSLRALGLSPQVLSNVPRRLWVMTV